MKKCLILKYASVFILLFLGCLPLSAQYSNGSGSRNAYYMFPIKPGERNSLSGTMGELRTSHFHAGIDIRTEGRTGLPVHAAADGYISRISVSRGGYGNALYIQHPNGHTTVYAHLQEFKGAVADHVREMQYDKQSFELTLYFNAGEFPVKQGEIVALSGNSGSSGGPHVHFDLRDRNQDLLNPLSYGFDEIPDNTPPIAQKVAVKALDKDARVDGKFGRFEYTAKRVGNDYVISEPIPVYGTVGLELYAHDRLDYSRFRCGINLLEVEVDEKQTYTHNITTFAFSEQRNILSHMDYEQVLNDRERFHKLYIDDGNYLRFYKTDDNKGKLKLTEPGEKKVHIRMTDSYGNSSTLTFTLSVREPSADLSAVNLSKPEWHLRENILHVRIPSNPEEINVDGDMRSADYREGPVANYLFDLREGIPQTIIAGNDTIIPGYVTALPHRSPGRYESSNMKLSVPAETLFDTLYLRTDYRYDKSNGRELFTIGDVNIPMRKRMTVTLHPHQTYEDPSKYAAYQIDNSNNAYFMGGSWKGDEFVFTTRDLGTYTLIADERPPTIRPLTLSADQLRFQIDDDLSGIDTFDCYVNGKWVLMYYDYKQKLLWSEKKSESDKFTGEVKLVVKDNVNNVKQYTTKIN